jgi:hypothetical protein
MYPCTHCDDEATMDGPAWSNDAPVTRRRSPSILRLLATDASVLAFEAFLLLLFLKAERCLAELVAGQILTILTPDQASFCLGQTRK